MAVALRQRIFFGFGFALVVLGVVSWFSYQNAAVTLDTARWVAHTREVLETLDGVLGDLSTAEAAYRDFLASGRDSSLSPLDSALNAAPASLARLGSLIADNPAQRQRLDSLKPLVAERLMWSRGLADIRRVRGVALAQRALAAAPVRLLTADVQRVADEMKAAEQLLLEERTATLTAAARRTKLMILAGTALALLLAALAAFQVSRDLAARQSAEQVLQQSEERFQALVDGGKDYAIFWLDPEGRVVSWNAGAERLKGYRADEIIGQHFSRFYTPEDVAAGKPARELRTAAAEGRVEDEGWRVRRDGSRLWVNVVITALRDRKGALFGFGKITRDMSERKRAEQALRESEERYRLLFDSNPLPAWVFDVETLQFLAVNDAAVRHYGYSREEFLAMTIKDIRPPEDVPRVLAAVAQLGPGVREGGAWRHRKRDGTLIDVEITSHVLTFGGRAAELVIAADITVRKRAEAALRTSEERFRALAVTANDGIISADVHGDIMYINPGAERMFGYAGSEVVGKPITVLMPERFRAAHTAGLQRYLATREARVVGKTVELTGRRQDGTEFPIDLSLAAWETGDGPAFTAILRDVTDRKRRDEQLRRYSAQLEAANAELDAFAYSVSHDLRAPLRGIDGFSQALLEDYQARLDDTGRGYLRRVRAATQRMAQLIDDLLGLSRVTRAEFRREAVDLSALAETVAADLKRSAPRREVEFVITPGVTADGDVRLLQVVLGNLLGNAWKYTAKRPRARIEFGCAPHDGNAAYYVRDNGAGFDMAYVSKLFGAFQRLHSSNEFEGTGIGLATVQRIVHRHGGKVWAEGAVDQGATFYFTL